MELKDGEEFKAYAINGLIRLASKKSNQKITVDSERFKHSFNSEPASINCDVIGNIFTVYWYNHGIKHRLEGPAFIWNDNGIIAMKEYWINGKEYTQEQFEIEANRIRLLNDL